MEVAPRHSPEKSFSSYQGGGRDVLAFDTAESNHAEVEGQSCLVIPTMAHAEDSEVGGILGVHLEPPYFVFQSSSCQRD